MKLIKAALSALLILVLTVLLVGGGLGKKGPLPASLTNIDKPLLIAHRGAPGANLGIPENSLRSFNRALERGYRWAELDVQLSADDEFFVFHDHNATRLLGVNTIPARLPLKEIRSFTLKPDNSIHSDPVPSLDDVIIPLGDSLNFFFDIKLHGEYDPLALADKLAKYLKEHNLTERAIVGCPSLKFIAYLEYGHPDIVTLLEVSSLAEMQWCAALPQLFKPDMYAGYTRVPTKELADWLVSEKMQDRFVAFHVTEETFWRDLDWGIVNYMIDDAPYLDSLLPQRVR